MQNQAVYPPGVAYWLKNRGYSIEITVQMDTFSWFDVLHELGMVLLRLSQRKRGFVGIM